MKRHLLGAALGALVLAAIPISASADPIPGDPVLEGAATTVTYSSNDTNFASPVCRALLTGEVGASTGIACDLYDDGVLVESSAVAYPGNAAVTTVSAAGDGPWTVCWRATAHTTDNEFLTESGCA